HDADQKIATEKIVSSAATSPAASSGSCPASIALLNTSTLPQKPEKGGMPASDSIGTANRKAKAGLLRSIPPVVDRCQEPVARWIAPAPRNRLVCTIIEWIM